MIAATLEVQAQRPTFPALLLVKTPLGVFNPQDMSLNRLDDAFVSRDLSLLPNNPKLITAKLFEFTEWVYKVRENPKTSLEQTIKVFQDCMRWYDSFFACTSNGSSETPLMMFAQ